MNEHYDSRFLYKTRDQCLCETCIEHRTSALKPCAHGDGYSCPRCRDDGDDPCCNYHIGVAKRMAELEAELCDLRPGGRYAWKATTQILAEALVKISNASYTEMREQAIDAAHTPTPHGWELVAQVATWYARIADAALDSTGHTKPKDDFISASEGYGAKEE